MTAEGPDDDLLKKIDAVLAEEVARIVTSAPEPVTTEPGEATVARIEEYARQLDEQLPEPMQKIKLTKDELDWLKAANPPIDRPPSLLDVPFELVDNPEESTLYRPPCCDRHSDRCEVPTECCDACPEAVELRAFVAEWKRGQAVYHSRYWNYPAIAPESEPEPESGWLARLFARWLG